MPPLSHPRSSTRFKLPAWGERVHLTWTDARTYLVVTLAAALVLALRQPSMLLNPQFIFEDGAIFFAQAYNLTPLEALGQLYAGYWHTVPRLIAEAGSLLPLQWVPLYYSLCALLVTAGAISWLILPLHTAIVANPWLRLAVILLIVLTPRPDGLMLVAYLQWYLALWAVLVTLGSAPTQRWLRWAMAAAYAAVAFTSPAMIVLTPIWLIHWWKAAPGQRLWNGCLAAVTLGSALPALIVSGMTGLAASQTATSALDTLRATSYHAFTLPLLGTRLADGLILQIGWWTSYLVAAIVLVPLVIGFATDTRPCKRWLGALLAYVAVAVAVLYLLRSGFYGSPYVNSPGLWRFGGGRYFFVSATLVLLGAAVQLERLLVARPKLTPALAGLAALLIVSASGSYSLPPWPDAHWSAYAALLSDLPKTQNTTAASSWASDQNTGSGVAAMLAASNSRYPVGGASHPDTPRPARLTATYVARLPLAQEDWFLTLFISNRWRGAADFPEGLRLLGDAVTQAGDELQVDLFWLGDPRTPHTEDHYYTAYVHLLNETGERVAGFDTLLKPTSKGWLPENVLRSQHPLAPPPAGTYRLKVGLYSLTDAGQLVPGNSVILDKEITLGEGRQQRP